MSRPILCAAQYVRSPELVHPTLRLPDRAAYLMQVVPTQQAQDWSITPVTILSYRRFLTAEESTPGPRIDLVFERSLDYAAERKALRGETYLLGHPGKLLYYEVHMGSAEAAGYDEFTREHGEAEEVEYTYLQYQGVREVDQHSLVFRHFPRAGVGFVFYRREDGDHAVARIYHAPKGR